MRKADGGMHRTIVVLESDTAIQRKITKRAQQAGLCSSTLTLKELYDLELPDNQAAGFFVGITSLADAHARAIRHICQASPDAEVVAMINDNDSQLAVGLFKMGARNVLMKPLSQAQLSKTIQDLQNGA